MPTNAKTNDREKSIKNNPCGICRAFGLPACKGHGAGSSGGDEAKEAESKEPMPSNVPNNIQTKDLSSYLETSSVWTSCDDFLYDFNHAFALFSVELDAVRGLIHFKANESLSASDEKDLNALYDQIENEFQQFSREVGVDNMRCIREGHDLKITIPNPKLYDQFVTRLLNKNLIPDNNYHADTGIQPNQAIERQSDNRETSAYQSPNPFDISKGPGFDGNE